MFKTSLFAAVLAATIGASARPQDVWDPKILVPNADTVWTAGSVQTVVW